MGKGDLWDDSALVRAFDDAFTKYKVMHGQGYKLSIEEGSNPSADRKDKSTPIDENRSSDEKHMKETTTAALNVAGERREVDNPSLDEPNDKANASVPESHHTISGEGEGSLIPCSLASGGACRDGSCCGGARIDAAGVSERLSLSKEDEMFWSELGAEEKEISSIGKKASAGARCEGENEGGVGPRAGTETDLTGILQGTRASA